MINVKCKNTTCPKGSYVNLKGHSLLRGFEQSFTFAVLHFILHFTFPLLLDVFQKKHDTLPPNQTSAPGKTTTESRQTNQVTLFPCTCFYGLTKAMGIE